MASYWSAGPAVCQWRRRRQTSSHNSISECSIHIGPGCFIIIAGLLPLLLLRLLLTHIVCSAWLTVTGLHCDDDQVHRKEEEERGKRPWTAVTQLWMKGKYEPPTTYKQKDIE